MTGFMEFPFVKGERLAEGVGNAPTSARADPVFKTGAASLYLPAFHELAVRVGLAPTPCGLTNRRATFTSPGNWKLALPAGLPLVSFRLEDGCLMCSATAATRNWSER